MSYYQIKDQTLFIEDCAVSDLAHTYGTPCYFYSRAAIEANWSQFTAAFKPSSHQLYYAVKANSNLAILQLLSNLGAGFDIVSAGELARVLKAGGDPGKIVFSGVGKQTVEIEEAIKAQIDCFNVESEEELIRLNEIALRHHTQIPIALRVNPNVRSNTHDYISTGRSDNKFGIEIDKVVKICSNLNQFPALTLKGIGAHIGSQITDIEPFLSTLDHLLRLYQSLKTQGINLAHLNLGGGLGIVYQDETPPTVTAYAHALLQKLTGYPVELRLEPGRAITGNAGILVTQVEYLKETPDKNFAIVNAGMNDFMRPALYGAWQSITPVVQRHIEKKRYDIVGPVCESADFFGKDRELAIVAGDLLAIHTAGAYGASMASNYNSRCRPAEVLVDKDQSYLIRRRESIQDLFAAENLID